MAKKIKVQDAEPEVASDAPLETNVETTLSENVDESTEQVEEVAELPLEKVAEEAPKKKAKKANSKDAQEPDEDVKRVLKSFPTYEYLYVNKQGGVFAPDTKPTLVGGAILYKNPFYNK